MILGFKDRFIPYVLDGSKTHTIRAGNRWRTGMRADLFRDVRQKSMALLFRAPVVRVQEIHIRNINVRGFGGVPDTRLGVVIDGCLLDLDETNDFFHRDGFRDPNFAPVNIEQSMFPSTNQAFLFWKDRLPFTGQIIHWDYTARFLDIPPKPRHSAKRCRRCKSKQVLTSDPGLWRCLECGFSWGAAA